MNADRYQRVKELFFAACAEPAEQRAGFLNRACAGDTSLRIAVEELLNNDQNPVTLNAMKFVRPHLEQFANSEEADSSHTDTPLPSRIGGFRILAMLGAGGMGVVYRAQQDHPQRIVALKVIACSPVGHVTASTLHRFEQEAQMLARLKHPGIAQIYEAGTGDWGVGLQPYFAMELVQGRPLMQFAEQAALNTRQRLELFIQICEAVEHAHQRGIIHRDLKPANILLDETVSPVQPKVLDFGVARIIDSDLQRTTFRTTGNQIIGTVAYMSPEQIGGDPHEVDTRSDVYSLGVVLFELLSGRLPHDLAGRPVVEAIRIVTHEEPMSLATTNRSLRGDLNTIVSRSLAHDKTRRYQSVRELARDVSHYLKDEPIEARRDSALYVMRKALRRYRVPVALLSLILILLVVSAVVAWTLYVGQQHATMRALDAQQKVEDRLHESLVLQARASRKNGMFDSRDAALEALSRAARIRPTQEIRNEAIATVALPGLKPVATGLPVHTMRAVDAAGETCVLLNDDQSETVYRVSDGSVVARIPRPQSTPVDFSALILLQVCGGYYARCYDIVGQPRRLELWRIPQGDLWMEFLDLPDRSRCGISPDERTIAVPRPDRSIRLIDLESRQEVRRINVEGDCGYVQFDPSGRLLVRYHDKSSPTEIHDLETGEVTHAFSGMHIGYALAWTNDGTMMAGADVLRVQLWDAVNRRSAGALQGHSDVIVSLRFSPDGRMLASYSWDGEGILWDVRRRQPLVRMRAMTMGWTIDGRRLVGNTSNDGYPTVLELQSGQECSYLEGPDTREHDSSWPIIAFDPQGQFIITGSSSAPSMRVYDIHSLGEICRADVGEITAIRIDDSGQWLVTSGEHGTRLWPITRTMRRVDLGPPRLIDSAPGHFVEISHNGRFIVHASGKSDGRFIIADREHPAASRFIPHSPSAIAPRFSNDDRWIAIGNWEGQNVEIWDVETLQKVAELATSKNTLVQFSPDDRFLATSDMQEMCMWDVQTLTRTVCGTSSQAGSMEFSPDGSVLATINNKKQIRLIDTRTMQDFAALEAPGELQPRLLRFSPDGTLLAFNTMTDHLVHIWNLRLVRERLGRMGLDWDLPPYPPPPKMKDSPPLQCEIRVEADTQDAVPP